MVTIIVLLLLAGVAISSLSGDNGILNRASEAKEKSQIAEIKEEAEIVKVDEGKWSVSGDTLIEDLDKETGLEIPESEDYDTIGGLVLSTLSTIPEDGSKLDIETDEVKIHVLSVKERRIERVEVEKKNKELTPPSEEQDHE